MSTTPATTFDICKGLDVNNDVNIRPIQSSLALLGGTPIACNIIRVITTMLKKAYSSNLYLHCFTTTYSDFEPKIPLDILHSSLFVKIVTNM